MKRREVLKQMAIAGAAAMLLPACVADPKKVSIALNNLKITGDEEELLGNFAETLVPETDTPGAKTVGAHLFALVMVDDCSSQEEKEKYLKGLRAFDDTCKKITGKSFVKATAEERTQILTTLQQKKETLAPEVKTFYEASRGLILWGYTSSEHFLTNVKPYKLVPGPEYKGCVPVSQPNV
jgi:hypothetical protein